jgi:hypothetical protein
MRRLRAASWLAVLLLAPSTAAAAAEVLDADAPLFVSPTLALAWAELTERKAQARVVVIRVVNTERRYHYVTVEGVDAAGRWRRPVVEGLPLNEEADVRSPRGSFADFPRREIRLYRTEAELRSKQPALIVRYTRIPEGMPEFTSEPGLQGYLGLAFPRR